ncbi:hypothetical protein ACFQX7_26720 [Luedemannella flava]
MTAAGQLQLIVLPWVATGLVLIFGRPAVLPLALIMSIVYLSAFMTLVYVRRRGVDTGVPRWTRPRIIFAVFGGTPYLLFGGVCVWSYFRDGATLVGLFVGAAIGMGSLAIGFVRDARRRRVDEAVGIADVD